MSIMTGWETTWKHIGLTGNSRETGFLFCGKVKNSAENEKFYILCTLNIIRQFALKDAELHAFVFGLRTLDFEVGTANRSLKIVPNIFRKCENLAQKLC